MMAMAFKEAVTWLLEHEAGNPSPPLAWRLTE